MQTVPVQGGKKNLRHKQKGTEHQSLILSLFSADPPPSTKKDFREELWEDLGAVRGGWGLVWVYYEEMANGT